jgi:hypothetical protein
MSTAEDVDVATQESGANSRAVLALGVLVERLPVPVYVNDCQSMP